MGKTQRLVKLELVNYFASKSIATCTSFIAITEAKQFPLTEIDENGVSRMSGKIQVNDNLITASGLVGIEQNNW